MAGVSVVVTAPFRTRQSHAANSIKKLSPLMWCSIHGSDSRAPRVDRQRTPSQKFNIVFAKGAAGIDAYLLKLLSYISPGKVTDICHILCWSIVQTIPGCCFWAILKMSVIISWYVSKQIQVYWRTEISFRFSSSYVHYFLISHPGFRTKKLITIIKIPLRPSIPTRVVCSRTT